MRSHYGRLRDEPGRAGLEWGGGGAVPEAGLNEARGEREGLEAGHQLAFLNGIPFQTWGKRNSKGASPLKEMKASTNSVTIVG